ncbi:MAG: hypothetical protein KGL39_10795 [Patescibacteria group bacterium]|nr:hypothetical protein [Patescibacteria group bacterium]
MPQTRSRALLITLSLSVATAGVLLALLARRGPDAGAPPRTPAELHRRLTESGLAYEARPFPRGLLLKSPASPLSWEDAERAAKTVSVRTVLPRGLVIVTPFDEGLGTVHDEEGSLVLHALYLRGGPEDLRAIVAAAGR